MEVQLALALKEGPRKKPKLKKAEVENWQMHAAKVLPKHVNHQVGDKELYHHSVQMR